MSQTEERRADESDQPKLDMIGVLLAVYEDISQHSTIEGETLADRWMCPLYKKNERDKISNYSPITC
jgi:hypothetical protein